MKNNTSLNILVSYAYLTSKKLEAFLKKEVERKSINIMIDSGAFTKHNAKGNYDHINLEDYCRFLSDWGEYAGTRNCRYAF